MNTRTRNQEGKMARHTKRKAKAKTYANAQDAAQQTRKFLSRIVRLGREIEDFSDDARNILRAGNQENLSSAYNHLALTEQDLACLLAEIGTRPR